MGNHLLTIWCGIQNRDMMRAMLMKKFLKYPERGTWWAMPCNDTSREALPMAIRADGWRVGRVFLPRRGGPTALSGDQAETARERHPGSASGSGRVDERLSQTVVDSTAGA